MVQVWRTFIAKESLTGISNQRTFCSLFGKMTHFPRSLILELLKKVGRGAAVSAGLARSRTLPSNRSLAASAFKTFCGSPMYFAPEVLRRKDTVYDRGSYSSSADLWSLGTITRHSARSLSFSFSWLLPRFRRCHRVYHFERQTTLC